MKEYTHDGEPLAQALKRLHHERPATLAGLAVCITGIVPGFKGYGAEHAAQAAGAPTMKADATRYEIRQVDAIAYDDGWTYNETWNIGAFTTASADVPRAFRRALANLGISFYRGRTRTEYDGDVYEIVDRKTGEPLFAAIPQA